MLQELHESLLDQLATAKEQGNAAEVERLQKAIDGLNSEV